ncbi:hypothetical protein ACFT9M_16965 [Micromonospora purpureochromogenes]|uniref:hypothetical protein n=1 Tax=Micromonospora purpureochromogenes TaxID=47872 RepID=UPI00362C113E
MAQERAVGRRRRMLGAGILAVLGLALLGLGLTVADGVLAGVEVVLAIVLLLASYALQYVARRETLYRHDDQR